MKKFVLCIAVSLVVVYGVLAQSTTDSGNRSQQDQVQLVYPRPAAEFLIVKLRKPHAKAVKITVRSLIGTPVKVYRKEENDYEIRLTLMGLPPGYYFLLVKNEEEGWSSASRFLKR